MVGTQSPASERVYGSFLQNCNRDSSAVNSQECLNIKEAPHPASTPELSDRAPNPRLVRRSSANYENELYSSKALEDEEFNRSYRDNMKKINNRAQPHIVKELPSQKDTVNENHDYARHFPKHEDTSRASMPYNRMSQQNHRRDSQTKSIGLSDDSFFGNEYSYNQPHLVGEMFSGCKISPQGSVVCDNPKLQEQYNDMVKDQERLNISGQHTRPRRQRPDDFYNEESKKFFNKELADKDKGYSTSGNAISSAHPEGEESKLDLKSALADPRICPNKFAYSDYKRRMSGEGK